MLNRQKILLRMVSLAGGEIDRLVLTKWAFLLRQESESRGGASFYDFVPYHYGPYSFTLYQEAEKLVTLGYLREAGDKKWAIGDAVAPSIEDRQVVRDLKRVSSQFRAGQVTPLLDYVYAKYPKFTVNSKRQKLASRPNAPCAVYTAGYEGKNVDAFLSDLTESGIAHLIDVRRNPIARRYGFHRSTLSRLCEKLNIKYTHVPSLGIPSELRQNLDSQDAYDSLFRSYETTTLKTQLPSIRQVIDWIKQSPSVLVCMEAEPKRCHRSKLAERLSRETGLPLVHLQ